MAHVVRSFASHVVRCFSHDHTPPRAISCTLVCGNGGMPWAVHFSLAQHPVATSDAPNLANTRLIQTQLCVYESLMVYEFVNLCFFRPMIQVKDQSFWIFHCAVLGICCRFIACLVRKEARKEGKEGKEGGKEGMNDGRKAGLLVGRKGRKDCRWKEGSRKGKNIYWSSSTQTSRDKEFSEGEVHLSQRKDLHVARRRRGKIQWLKSSTDRIWRVTLLPLYAKHDRFKKPFC